MKNSSILYLLVATVFFSDILKSALLYLMPPKRNDDGVLRSAETIAAFREHAVAGMIVDALFLPFILSILYLIFSEMQKRKANVSS